jgi:hypothetical protein
VPVNRRSPRSISRSTRGRVRQGKWLLSLIIKKYPSECKNVYFASSGESPQSRTHDPAGAASSSSAGRRFAVPRSRHRSQSRRRAPRPNAGGDGPSRESSGEEAVPMEGVSDDYDSL